MMENQGINSNLDLKNSLNLPLTVELRKRKEKTMIQLSYEDLKNSQDKILIMLKKECADLKSWFFIILFYYSQHDFQSFKRFSDELFRIDVDTNPLYRDQKQTFIYILNIFSFYYSHLAGKSQKEKSEEYSTLSTSCVNQAEKISMYDQLTMICKGFLFFAQGDYDNSDMYFSNISETPASTKENIVILAKIGRALNAYNKADYLKAIEYYSNLIRDHDYINENIMESLGICYYNIGKVEKAAALFHKVAELNPKNFKVLTYMFTLSNWNEKNAKFLSESDVKSLLINAYNNDEESFPPLLIQVSNIFLFTGKIKEAEEICGKLNSLLDSGEMKSRNKSKSHCDEIKSSIYLVNAKLKHCQKKNTEAFTLYTQAVVANPKNFEAQFGLGQINLLMSNLPEAEKCFMECKKLHEGLSLDKKVESTYAIDRYLAFICARTRRKEVEKTINMFKEVLSIKKDDIVSYLEIAQLLEFKKPEESLKYYEEALIIIRDKINGKIISQNETLLDLNYSHSNRYSNLLINENSLYDIEDIFPEILNNIATIKIRLHLFEDTDKLLYEALEIIKERKSKINKDKENRTSTMSNEIKESNNTSNSNNNSSLINNSNVPHSQHNHSSHNNANKSNLNLGGKSTTEYILRLESLQEAIMFNFGLLKEAQCDFDDAYKYFKSVIKKNQYFIEAYLKLGEMAKMRGNKRKAKEYFNLAISKHFEGGESENKKLETNSATLAKNLNSNTNPHMPTSNINNSRLIPVMKKPIDANLLLAQISFENGNENEALGFLSHILKNYDEKDSYTLVFMGNIFYEMAVNLRGKEDFGKYLGRALEMYYRSVQEDKYNAFGAMGIANILCECGVFSQGMETYKLLAEKMSKDPNSQVNEALVYMNLGNWAKASTILGKLLKKTLTHYKIPEIENLYARAMIELKDFETAENVLKNLLLRFPENVFYKFNLALVNTAKAEDLLTKQDRSVRETDIAIKLLEKSIPVFQAIYNMRKEITAGFKTDREERSIRSSDFFHKCSEVLQSLHITLNNSKETLKSDKLKEEETLRKIEENRIKYNLMLKNMKESDYIQREELNKKIADNERYAESFKEKMEKIIELGRGYEMEKEKKKKPKKKKEEEKEKEEDFIKEDEFEENEQSEDRSRKGRKRPREDSNESEEDNGEIGVQHEEGKKVKKLRKKMKLEEEEENRGEMMDETKQEIDITYGNPILDQFEENYYENSNLRDESQKEELRDLEMKNYSKNEPDEEVDFN